MSSRASGQEGKQVGLWTPANVVTCVRIVFIPVFMAFSLAAYGGAGLPGVPAAGCSIAAFVLYALLSATDKVDGDLARKRGEVTDFGKFLDPIADKLLVFSALLIFCAHGEVNVWFVFVILLREFLVSALRMIAGAKGVVIAADMLGKCKTAVTMLAICALLLAQPLGMHGVAAASGLWWAGQVLMVAAVALTVASGVQYFWNARGIFTEGA